MGQVSIPLATPDGFKPIIVSFDIVQADVPAIIGMDVLDRENLVADTVYNRLASRKSFAIGNNIMIYVYDWLISLTRSASKHVYVPIDRGNRFYFSLSHISSTVSFFIILPTISSS